MERAKIPVISPEFEYEQHGVEDPRVVLLDGVYYMFYTAYDGKNALIAYATSKGLKAWEKHRIISPQMTYDEAEEFFRMSKLKDRYFFFESYYKDIIAPDVLLWEKVDPLGIRRLEILTGNEREALLNEITSKELAIEKRIPQLLTYK